MELVGDTWQELDALVKRAFAPISSRILCRNIKFQWPIIAHRQIQSLDGHAVAGVWGVHFNRCIWQVGIDSVPKHDASDPRWVSDVGGYGNRSRDAIYGKPLARCCDIANHRAVWIAAAGWQYSGGNIEQDCNISSFHIRPLVDRFSVMNF